MCQNRGMVPLPDLTGVLSVMRGAPRSVEGYRAFSDAGLTAHGVVMSQLRTLLDAHAALWAGEVARRSAPELGSAGLVQRAGHRTVVNRPGFGS